MPVDKQENDKKILHTEAGLKVKYFNFAKTKSAVNILPKFRMQTEVQ